jgi:D-alanyl-D-alanine dipeptidase
MRKILILAMALVLTGCIQSEPETVVLPPETTVSVIAETVLPTEEVQKDLPVPDSRILVVVSDYLPEISTELKYATPDNFTGQVIYDFTDVYLRYGTVAKLKAVKADLKEFGLSLKIWDAFRPVSAQYKLWEVCPDRRYVADPGKGFSDHSRGNTVDVTLVDKDGGEVVMPTGFDDFTAKADRDYSDCTEEAKNNAMILQLLMEKHGFTGYKGEWWHFTDNDEYPVEETFQP